MNQRRKENLRGQRQSRVPVELSSDHGKNFHQLENFFVNITARSKITLLDKRTQFAAYLRPTVKG